MAVNKVVYGGNTLIDLTSDTATASDVAQGKTFHLADGTQATGTASGGGGEEVDPPNDGKTHLFIKAPGDGFVYNPLLRTSSSGHMIIDWGDGTTDTISSNNPTHLYRNAGKYEITISGYGTIQNYGLGSSGNIASTAPDAVRAMALERAYFYNPNLEFYSSGASCNMLCLRNCMSLKKIRFHNNMPSIKSGSSFFSLEDVEIPPHVTSISPAFSNCYMLTSIVIPESVTSIDASAFRYSRSLKTVRMLPTTPPTIGTYVFSYTHPDMVIYVPSASLEAYQTAENWSTYASQMVGE